MIDKFPDELRNAYITRVVDKPKHVFKHQSKESIPPKEKAQHSFTIEVINSDGYDHFEKGKKIIRKGRTIYKTARKIKESANFKEKQLAKNQKSNDAKMKKYLNWYNEGKTEKIPASFYKETGLPKL